MKRQIERKLQVWAKQKNRKPLILNGLRQSGKTYILKNWGKRTFSNIHYVNFEQSESVCRIFDVDLNPGRILQELSFFFDTSIQVSKDLIIFDEIQACPRAITSLKYFYEEMPEAAVACAGSLIGLHLNDVSFPVGKVESLSLYPMSFDEFLLALEDQKLFDLLANTNLRTRVPELAHERLWQRLKWYFVTGGLPEVVATFCEHQNDLYTAFVQVREKQRQLLIAYYADFAKHAGKENAMHIDRVWRAVPQQLAGAQDATAGRFQFSGIVPGIDRYQNLAGAIDWLVATGLVLPAFIVNHAQLPLPAFVKKNMFKLYCCDVGLLGALSELPPQAILNYDYGTYKGYFAENFVAQEFVCHQPQKLYCWQQERAEIEFLCVAGADVIPVEVKSGKVTRAKSLQKFIERYHPSFAATLSGSNLVIDNENRIHHYPLYLAGHLPLRDV